MLRLGNKKGGILVAATAIAITFLPAEIAEAASLTITQQSALTFGTVEAPSSGTGLLTINAQTGAQSYDITGSLISADAHGQAQFLVAGGKSGDNYTVTLPTTGTVGGNSISSFTVYSPDNFTFDTTGQSHFYLGATVSIAAGAASGTLTGGSTSSLTASETSPVRSGSLTASGITLKIARPMSLTKVTDVSFGDIVAGSKAGTVVLSTSGTRTVTGGVSLGASTGASAGSFNLSGEPNAAYNVTVTPATLDLNGPGAAMTVDTWTPSISSGTLPTGTQNIALGGTLHVGANQTAGSYSGIVTISTDYQ